MKTKGVLVLVPIGSVIPIFLGGHENFELIYELSKVETFNLLG